MDERICENCGADISHKRANALACSVECNHARLAARRKAAKWEGVDPDRPCAWCETPMTGKRPHAEFCSRSCKARAHARVSTTASRNFQAQPERDCDDCGTRLPANRHPATRFCGRQCHNRTRYKRESERRKEYARQYLKDNPEKMRAIRRNRKSRIKAERFLVTERDWRRLVARYRGCCAYCDQPSDTLHREHIIPIIRGGRHSIGNLVPACPPCNYRKKTKLLAEFRRDQKRAGVIIQP